MTCTRFSFCLADGVLQESRAHVSAVGPVSASFVWGQGINCRIKTGFIYNGGWHVFYLIALNLCGCASDFFK